MITPSPRRRTATDRDVRRAFYLATRMRRAPDDDRLDVAGIPLELARGVRVRTRAERPAWACTLPPPVADAAYPAALWVALDAAREEGAEVAWLRWSERNQLQRRVTVTFPGVDPSARAVEALTLARAVAHGPVVRVWYWIG